jgi:hypothetical protein
VTRDSATVFPSPTSLFRARGRGFRCAAALLAFWLLGWLALAGVRPCVSLMVLWMEQSSGNLWSDGRGGRWFGLAHLRAACQNCIRSSHRARPLAMESSSLRATSLHVISAVAASKRGWADGCHGAPCDRNGSSAQVAVSTVTLWQKFGK